jgi:hypothetical protein
LSTTIRWAKTIGATVGNIIATIIVSHIDVKSGADRSVAVIPAL